MVDPDPVIIPCAGAQIVVQTGIRTSVLDPVIDLEWGSIRRLDFNIKQRKRLTPYQHWSGFQKIFFIFQSKSEEALFLGFVTTTCSNWYIILNSSVKVPKLTNIHHHSFKLQLSYIFSNIQLLSLLGSCFSTLSEHTETVKELYGNGRQSC